MSKQDDHGVVAVPPLTESVMPTMRAVVCEAQSVLKASQGDVDVLHGPIVDRIAARPTLKM